MYQDVGFGDYGADFGADAQASTQPTGFWQQLSQRVLDTSQKVVEDKVLKKPPPAPAPTLTTIYQGIDVKYLVISGVVIAAIAAVMIAKKRSQRYAT
jgi:hypothetical protein